METESHTAAASVQCGDYWKGEDWFFIQDDALWNTFPQLPVIPFHGLRHTSATILIARHSDIKTVQQRLGHAEASTTMNIYAHALELP